MVEFRGHVPFTSILVAPMINNLNFRKPHPCQAQDEFSELQTTKICNGIFKTVFMPIWDKNKK